MNDIQNIEWDEAIAANDHLISFVALQFQALVRSTHQAVTASQYPTIDLYKLSL